jgi:hypothetical protein
LYNIPAKPYHLSHNISSISWWIIQTLLVNTNHLNGLNVTMKVDNIFKAPGRQSF